MKVIDLLNKIANKEKVPKFKIYHDEYYVSSDWMLKDEYGKNAEWYIYETWLNEEIEIIEEKPKKIEKLTHFEFADKVAVSNKINELIDVVNDLKDSIV